MLKDKIISYEMPKILLMMQDLLWKADNHVTGCVFIKPSYSIPYLEKPIGSYSECLEIIPYLHKLFLWKIHCNVIFSFTLRCPKFFFPSEVDNLILNFMTLTLQARAKVKLWLSMGWIKHDTVKARGRMRSAAHALNVSTRWRLMVILMPGPPFL
jgi:hypothetical protein